jgi:hypothetical protein
MNYACNSLGIICLKSLRDVLLNLSMNEFETQEEIDIAGRQTLALLLIGIIDRSIVIDQNDMGENRLTSSTKAIIWIRMSRCILKVLYPILYLLPYTAVTSIRQFLK